MLLDGKTAVVYGAGGAIGGAVARSFAREGARLFLVGRSRQPLEQVAAEIDATGGDADVAQVDALDASAVEEHLDGVMATTGRLDVSFNAIGMGGLQGTQLTELSADDFFHPIAIGTRAQFLTARGAGRRMTRQASGTILAITATPARLAFPLVGGFGVACAAIEALCRSLSAELGPHGVRVVCLRSPGSPDAPGVARAWEANATAAGITREEFQAQVESGTLLKRLPTLAEIGSVAAFTASDQAGPMTATVVNLTAGAVTD